MQIAVVVRLRPGAEELTLERLRDWSRDKLPPYSLPKILRVVDQVPRNPMGKVNKKSLVKEIFPEN